MCQWCCRGRSTRLVDLRGRTGAIRRLRVGVDMPVVLQRQVYFRSLSRPHKRNSSTRVAVGFQLQDVGDSEDLPPNFSSMAVGRPGQPTQVALSGSAFGKVLTDVRTLLGSLVVAAGGMTQMAIEYVCGCFVLFFPLPEKVSLGALCTGRAGPCHQDRGGEGGGASPQGEGRWLDGPHN